MKTYKLHEARSNFSSIVDRALAGEPQRVARHGKDVVVIASEADWKARPKTAATLCDLMLQTIGRDDAADAIGDRAWATDSRPLGSDFGGS